MAAADVQFEVPARTEQRERLGSVLSVVYLVFTEGSSESSGTQLIRTDPEGEPVLLEDQDRRRWDQIGHQALPDPQS